MYPHWTRVRRVKVDFAAPHPRFSWVNTDDLNDGLVRSGERFHNDLRHSIRGYRALGVRFAKEAIVRTRRSKRPHIVLVMADDHGRGDTGYNGHPFVQMPTLDLMAAEGSSSIASTPPRLCAHRRAHPY